MQISCPYCGESFPDTESVCPRCGAPNDVVPSFPHGRRPQTLDELKTYCAARRLPLEKMRFFIDQDYQNPRAYGIFQDSDGYYVVYKNKSDGTRAVRYRGRSEAEAVGELYDRIKRAISEHRSSSHSHHASHSHHSSSISRCFSFSPSKSYASPVRKKKFVLSRAVLILIIVVFSVCLFFLSMKNKEPARGYYRYNDRYYYYQNGNWYTYDDSSMDWSLAYVVDDMLEEAYSSYYESYSWDDEYDASDFSDSIYYLSPDGSSNSANGQDSSTGDEWSDTEYKEDDWDVFDDNSDDYIKDEWSEYGESWDDFGDNSWEDVASDWVDDW